MLGYALLFKAIIKLGGKILVVFSLLVANNFYLRCLLLGMFGPSFGQPSSYNYFPNNGDYNTWGSQQVNAGSAAQSRKNHTYDDYYRDNAYPPGHDGIKVSQSIS